MKNANPKLLHVIWFYLSNVIIKWYNYEYGEKLSGCLGLRKGWGPGRIAKWVGAPSPTPKSCGFDPCLRCVWEATNWCFFSHWCFSLFLSHSLSLSLFLSLSKINKHVLKWGLKNKRNGWGGQARGYGYSKDNVKGPHNGNVLHLEWTPSMSSSWCSLCVTLAETWMTEVTGDHITKAIKFKFLTS